MSEQINRGELLIKAIRDPKFREELIRDPIGSMEREFGRPVPEGFEFVIQEDTKNKLHINIPYIDALENKSDDKIWNEIIVAGPSVTHVHKTYTHNGPY